MKKSLLFIERNNSGDPLHRHADGVKFAVAGTFPSAAAALKFLKSGSADAIVVDGGVSRLAYPIQKTVKQLAGSGLPVILVLGADQGGDNIGMEFIHGILARPIHGKHLTLAIELAIARCRHEKTLDEKGEKYRLLADNSTDVIWTMDLGGRFTYLSPSAEQVTGMPVPEIMKIPAFKCMPPESSQKLKKILEGELAKPERKRLKSLTLEIQHYRKDFTIIDAELKTSWLKDGHGAVIGLQGSVREISERKKFEENLRKSTELYKVLTDNTSDIIWMVNMSLVFTYTSPSVKRFLGYEPEELVGQHASKVLSQRSLQEAGQALVQEIQNENREELDPGRARIIVSENIHKDGSPRWAEFSARFIRDSEGKPVGILGVTRDVTERVMAEKKVNLSYTHMALVNELNTDLHRGVSLDELIKKACDRLKEIHNLRYDIFWSLHGTEKPYDYFQLKYTNIDSSVLTFVKKLLRIDPYSHKIRLFPGSIYREFYDEGCPREFNGPEAAVRLLTDLAGKNSPMLKRILKKYPRGILYDNLYLVPVIINDRPIGHFGFNKISSFDSHEKEAINLVIDKIAWIMERKRIEEELVRARERAEQASQAKSDFLTRMSHEIRTPMNSIVGLTDLVLMTDSEREKLDYLLTVKDSVYHLLGIINDILEYSRIEADKMDLREEKFDLVNAAESAVNSLHMEAVKKGISLRLRVDDSLNRHVVGDQGKIRQILLNLIGNAIKFTGKGSIEVSIEPDSRGRKQQGRTAVRFSVKDTGIGIAKEHLETIFESFSQVDTSFTRKYSGTGLGLAITRRLVRLMGGEIEVKSRIGKGSSFSFHLNMDTWDPRSETPRVHRAPEPVEQGGKHLRILMAEDNAVNARILYIFIKKLGHEVTVVDDGFKVMKAMEGERFDMIFLDIEMPRMDGLETARKIREGAAGPGSRDIPIVAITAHVLPHVKEQCMKIGINDYLAKPLDMGNLSRVIRNNASPRKN